MLIKTKRETGWQWMIHRPDRGHGLGPTLIEELSLASQELLHSLPSLHEEEFLKAQSLVIGTTPLGKKRSIWIAGGDLKELSQLTSYEAGRTYGAAVSHLLGLLEALPLPVIMAIDGDAIGGGIEFALAGDLRIATEDSRFHFKQCEIGLATGYGSCQRLIPLIGKSQAQNLLLRGLNISAKEAKSMGLIHEVVKSRKALFEIIETISDDLNKKSFQALRIQKLMLKLAGDYSPAIAKEKELDGFATLWMAQTHREFLTTKMLEK